MKMITINLTAENAQTIAVNGDYFRLISCDQEITLEFPDAGIKTQFLTGLGMRLPNAYKSVIITAPVDTTARIMYGFGDVDDARLTGVMDLSGVMEVIQQGGARRATRQVTVPAATATEILPLDLARIQAQILFNGSGRVGVDGTISAVTGFPVAAGGFWEDNNTSAFWVYSTDGMTVDIIEGFRV